MSQPDTNEVDQNDRYAMDLHQPVEHKGQQQQISADPLKGGKSGQQGQSASQPTSQQKKAAADNDQPDLPLNQGEMWHEQMADAQGNEAED